MRAEMDSLLLRLEAAEAGLACAQRNTVAIKALTSQLVPQAELQLQQLDELLRQAAESAIAVATAATAASAQQSVTERLNILLTEQQTECADLHAQLQVFPSRNTAYVNVW